jgi:hypothetical protein
MVILMISITMRLIVAIATPSEQKGRADRSPGGWQSTWVVGQFAPFIPGALLKWEVAPSAPQEEGGDDQPDEEQCGQHVV